MLPEAPGIGLSPALRTIVIEQRQRNQVERSKKCKAAEVSKFRIGIPVMQQGDGQQAVDQQGNKDQAPHEVKAGMHFFPNRFLTSPDLRDCLPKRLRHAFGPSKLLNFESTHNGWQFRRYFRMLVVHHFPAFQLGTV